jgi:hypothetical protein
MACEKVLNQRAFRLQVSFYHKIFAEMMQLTCSAMAGAEMLLFRKGAWADPPTNGDASSVSNIFM